MTVEENGKNQNKSLVSLLLSLSAIMSRLLHLNTGISCFGCRCAFNSPQLAKHLLALSPELIVDNGVNHHIDGRVEDNEHLGYFTSIRCPVGEPAALKRLIKEGTLIDAEDVLRGVADEEGDNKGSKSLCQSCLLLLVVVAGSTITSPRVARLDFYVNSYVKADK